MLMQVRVVGSAWHGLKEVPRNSRRLFLANTRNYHTKSHFLLANLLCPQVPVMFEILPCILYQIPSSQKLK